MTAGRMILGLLMITASAGASAQNAGPSDPNIQYFGRWDKSNAASYHSYWGGAYLKVRFTGTNLKINLGQTTTLLVNIDDTADRMLTDVSGTVNLTPMPLPASTHTVRIAAQFDEKEIVFNGLILDSSATTVAPEFPGNKIIEFIGDSITTGADNPYGDGDAFAWLASDVLGAEHTQISDPGITLLGMEGAYLRLKTPNYTDNNPNWNFSYVPDAIVINLGSNDHYSNQSPSVFQAHYIDFLAALRRRYPQTEIFVLRLFNGWFANETLNAVNARIASGDTRVRYVDTTGWLSGYGDPNTVDYVRKPGGSVHPSRLGHVKVAKRLAPILLPYLHLPFTQHRIEAEDLTLSNYAVEANANASFLNDIKVPASGTGSASYTFPSSSGTSRRANQLFR
jgi:lysophospholipase L1-like esterase